MGENKGELREAQDKKLSPREWLCSGGGGFEDGEDGIGACTMSANSAIELMELYVEYLGEVGAPRQSEADSPIALRAILKDGDTASTIAHELSHIAAQSLTEPLAVHLEALQIAMEMAADKLRQLDLREHSRTGPAPSLIEAERRLRIISEMDTLEGISYIVNAGSVMKNIAKEYFDGVPNSQEDAAKQG